MSSEIGNEDAHHPPTLKLLRSMTISLDMEFPQPRKFGSYIGEVPKEFREGNEHQYTPRTVSIGPLHASSPRLFRGQEIKLQYLRSFISRLSEGKDLGFLLKLMEMNIEAVSSYYDPATLEIGRCDIVQMMVLDGCFIIELLSRYLEEAANPNEEFGLPISWETGIVSSLRRDILLLENQLPYFVLQLLYDQTHPDRRVQLRLPSFPNSNPQLSLSQLIRKFILPLLPVPLTDRQFPLGIDRPANHLLELAWNTILPKHTTAHSMQERGHMRDGELFSLLHGKSASELVPYGVGYEFEFDFSTSLAHASFKSKLLDRKSALELDFDVSTSLAHASFNSGFLCLPFMFYRDSTQSLFWNLLAFEQLADSKRQYYFQSYVLFMNRLIKTEKDVRILARSAINVRVRELADIVSLFDSLSRKVNYDDITNFCYGDVLEKMDRYCHTGIRPVRAYLVHLFTSARWDPVSAILLFILTVTQTYFAVVSYRS